MLADGSDTRNEVPAKIITERREGQDPSALTLLAHSLTIRRQGMAVHLHPHQLNESIPFHAGRVVQDPGESARNVSLIGRSAAWRMSTRPYFIPGMSHGCSSAPGRFWAVQSRQAGLGFSWSGWSGCALLSSLRRDRRGSGKLGHEQFSLQVYKRNVRNLRTSNCGKN